MRTTKLEFLESALKTSATEILEELETTTDGGNVTVAHATIRKILKDLIHSVDHFDELALEINESEMPDVKKLAEKFNSDPDDSKFKFKVGDSVRVLTIGATFFPAVAKNFDLKPDDFIKHHEHLSDGDLVVVVARRYSEKTSSKQVYIIRNEEERLFFIAERGIELLS